MYLTPFLHFVIESPHNMTKILSILGKQTEPYSSAQTHSKPKKFIGSIDENGFKLQNKLHRFYENDFNPVAIGSITELGDKSSINIYFRPTFSSCLFMLFFIGITVKELIGWFLGYGNSNWFYSGLLFIGYIFMQIGFWIEAPKLENNLRNLLKTQN